jgi:hypothetical protein
MLQLLGANENINPSTPELNPSAQRCLKRFFTGDFAFLTVHFVNVCVKNQQTQNLLVQLLIMYGSSKRTTSLNTTRPSTIFYRLLLN